MANLKVPRRLVLCDRFAGAANSTRMERQMLVHFERERDANHADARELMRLIAERAQERDVEKLKMLNEMVFEACSDILDNTVFMTSLVDDEMADVILDDLLQKEFNEHEHVKDDKEKEIEKDNKEKLT
ncbi:hypothetical protein Tco_0982080 [Tanacetum coccineum]